MVEEQRMSDSRQANNLTWHEMRVSREIRQARTGHPSFVIWLTGLSGAGKSTIANALEARLFDMGMMTYVLDGDNVRMGLNANLGFTEDDRHENIRRVGEVARLFVDAGVITIVSLISPLEIDRAVARTRFTPGEFVEVFVECPVEECMKRDPKGLYRKAVAGEILNFTGVNAPYEAPTDAEITIHTSADSIEECLESIIAYLRDHRLLVGL